MGTITLVMHWMWEIWEGDPNDTTPPLREVRKCSYTHAHCCKTSILKASITSRPHLSFIPLIGKSFGDLLKRCSI